MLVNDYINYFEDLAVSHQSIRHVKAAISGDAEPGTMKFATYNYDDVISKNLRTKVGFPAMLLEMFEWSLVGSDVYDPKTKYTGAITIVDHAKKGSLRNQIEKFASTEIIIWDLLQKMYSDHYGSNAIGCGSPFTSIDVNPSNCTPVGPLFDNEYGWRFEFTFRPKQQRSLFTAPAPGIFI